MTANPLKSMKYLPGPKTVPIFGNALQFRPTSFHSALLQWSEEFGSIFKIQVLGRKIVVVNDPEYIAEMLLDRPKGFIRIQSIADTVNELNAGGLFSAEAKEWTRQKRILSPGFSKHQMGLFFPKLLEIGERLEQRLKREKESGAPVDIKRVMTNFTVDVTTSFAYGHDGKVLENGDDEIQEHLNFLFSMINRRVQIPLRYWKYFKLSKDRKLDKSMIFVQTFLSKHISRATQRLKQEPSPKTVLDTMILAGRDEGHPFTHSELTGNVLTLMLAGEDTTSNTLAWTIWYLAQNLKTLKTLKNEFQQFSRLDSLSFEDIQKLTYLDAVIKESMRLKPVAPFLFLESNRHANFCGYSIPKGTALIPNFYPNHLSAKNFEAPLEFRPERWQGVDENIMQKIFLPFGGGAKNLYRQTSLNFRNEDRPYSVGQKF